MSDSSTIKRHNRSMRRRGGQMHTGHIQRRDGSSSEMPLLISVPEAARLLGVGTTFGWMLVHNGELPSVRLGRRVLIPRAALERLANSDENEAVS